VSRARQNWARPEADQHPRQGLVPKRGETWSHSNSRLNVAGCLSDVANDAQCSKDELMLWVRDVRSRTFEQFHVSPVCPSLELVVILALRGADQIAEDVGRDPRMDPGPDPGEYLRGCRPGSYGQGEERQASKAFLPKRPRPGRILFTPGRHDRPSAPATIESPNRNPSPTTVMVLSSGSWEPC
jgi:hypothetical protein